MPLRLLRLLLPLLLHAAAAERLPIRILHDAKDEVESGLPASSIYRLSAKDIDGNLVQLSTFSGKVTLVVNLASK